MSKELSIAKRIARFTLSLPHIQRQLKHRPSRQPRTVLVYPGKLKWYYTLNYIIRVGGHRLTTNLRDPFDAAFYFEDATVRSPDPAIQSLAAQRKVFNIDSTDIGKSRTDAVFEKVFGYSLSIDPTTYVGDCVVKSNLNGLHDGKIIQCPISNPEPGKVYQKLIESELVGGHLQEIRIVVMRETIPIVYVKAKLPEHRFGRNEFSRPASPDSILSDEETGQILTFCREMGLDFAELDAGRSREDGRIYIFDANNTPSTNWKRFSVGDIRYATGVLCDRFETLFF